MAKRKFKTESQKLLDMMINSIYTNREIFLRELISNASDAIDKLYYRSLNDGISNLSREDFRIDITLHPEQRCIVIRDNGCGMTAEELDSNLGVIAASGTQKFQQEDPEAECAGLIGQFGIGFYSSFMVSQKVEVVSKAYGSEQANRWKCSGLDGYSIEPCEKETHGTEITLYLKEDSEEVRYSDFLEPFRITTLIKKYSDYISYPIYLNYESDVYDEKGQKTGEKEQVCKVQNSMIPIWRKNPSELDTEAYNSFYQDKFHDYQPPLHMIRASAEGRVSYDALMFIPKEAPLNYYGRGYEKGLQLYTNGVLIMDKCADLLPDYFNFVQGVVDSADLSLNVSRELLQQDSRLQLISRNIEKKIRSELEKMLKNEREKYEEFYNAFGLQLKFGICQDFGQHKEVLQDLLLFYSSYEKKLVTLKEYFERMKEGQDTIYYACGETLDKCTLLPQTEQVLDKGYEILYLTNYADEFVFQMMGLYEQKSFTNVCADDLDLATEEEKAALAQANEQAADLFKAMQEIIGEEVEGVRFTNKLKKFPVCLTSEGEISAGIAKVMTTLGKENQLKAHMLLEINAEHPIADKLRNLYENDRDKLARYTQILYAQARLIGGMEVNNPAELTEMICDLMV